MKVKEVMIPISQYVTVDLDSTLRDVFEALDEDFKGKSDKCHAHRDVVVLDVEGEFAGLVTMVDIIRSLEPNYAKISHVEEDAVLTGDYVLEVFKRFGLWHDSLEGLCEKAVSLKVGDAMHIPDADETVDEEDELGLAIHKYIFGAEQPIIVRGGGRVTGVLRLSDIFEVVRGQMLACAL
ncbi:CBS domain-containing protein [Salidesulfovibrio onnuriiensis]|uniref:CBS domain-containing protein n=1 Tax=Salidesulfovibrio onnuriiensis TaxID=2583823 RepID=UPI0011CAE102|nr:CBS domain-containing protein [Salidesulfovibrio onnuriiensis]